MSYVRAFAAAVIAVGLVGGVRAEPASYTLSGDNTKIEFVGAKKDGTHTGSFPKLSGTASAEGADPATLKLNIVIDVNSMQTDAAKLTAHLKSPDFFEVRTYPKASFKSTQVTAGDGGKYTVTGDLTLHGVTKSVQFPAKISANGTTVTLNAEFTINRTEFNMTYGPGKVNNDVTLKVSVKAPRK